MPKNRRKRGARKNCSSDAEDSRRLMRLMDELKGRPGKEWDDGINGFAGRCAYCGRELYDGHWHWMYDEFGQQVKKCNDERNCHRRRAEIPGMEDSFHRAIRLFNHKGTGKWLESEKEGGNE